jgi:hypothetical protein
MSLTQVSLPSRRVDDKKQNTQILRTTQNATSLVFSPSDSKWKTKQDGLATKRLAQRPAILFHSAAGKCVHTFVGRVIHFEMCLTHVPHTNVRTAKHDEKRYLGEN